MSLILHHFQRLRIFHRVTMIKSLYSLLQKDGLSSLNLECEGQLDYHTFIVDRPYYNHFLVIGTGNERRCNWTPFHLADVIGKWKCIFFFLSVTANDNRLTYFFSLFHIMTFRSLLHEANNFPVEFQSKHLIYTIKSREGIQP